MTWAAEPVEGSTRLFESLYDRTRSAHDSNGIIESATRSGEAKENVAEIRQHALDVIATRLDDTHTRRIL